MGSIYIIGMGADGPDSLSIRAQKLVAGADLLLGGERLLKFFEYLPAEKIPLKSNLRESCELIKDRLGNAKIVVLASGDPGFYGVARYLIAELGKEAVEIIPGVSSVQLAFARIKENWDDAVLLSAHARPIDDVIIEVKRHPKVAVLTDGNNTPSAIANALLQAGLNECQAYVCENLGRADERVTEVTLPKLKNMSFSPTNVVILLNNGIIEQTSVRKQTLGIPDDQFYQKKPLNGLITKAEIRVISLSKMQITEESTVWDVGAGSGSVSIEAAFLAKRGRVFAIEKDPENLVNIEKNVDKFGTRNVSIVQGLAPEAFINLPRPDAVFIGGSGGELKEILEVVCKRLKTAGRIVANMATINNLNDAIQILEGQGYQVDVSLINIARSKPIAGSIRFDSLNPVFVVEAFKRTSLDEVVHGE